MIKCIVIDDEPLARECVSEYIGQIDFLELVAVGNDPVELTSLLNKHEADLIFLDIQMPKMNGIEYLKMTKNPPMIIITTAYPSYALQGFDLDVMDYLVKPIIFERFFKAATKARDYYQLLKQSDQPIERDLKEEPYFFIKCDYKFERIFFHQILFVEAVQNYVNFHTTKGKFMTLMTLKSVEDKLGQEQFMRVHKSFIIASDKVDALEGNQIVIGESYIPISRNFRKEVTDKLVGKRVWR